MQYATHENSRLSATVTMSGAVMIKTLSGREIAVQVPVDGTILSVKQALSEMADAEFPPVERQKLIHQGKVLLDGQLVREMQLDTGSFIVLMVTKPVSVAPRSPPPLPEAAGVAAAAPAAAPPALPAVGASEEDPFFALRNNPDFPAIHARVRADPSTLPTVIQMLAQSSPFLLDLIQRNQNQFMALFNEPLPGGGGEGHQGMMYDEQWGDHDDDDDEDYDDDMGYEGADQIQNDMQMLQVLAGLSPEERVQFAAALGIQPDRFQELMAMLNSLPPEALEDLMQGDEGAVADTAELNDAEREAIDRLTSLGFTNIEAANAFLSCNRNEEQAANFLLDGGMYADDDDDADYEDDS